MKSERIRKRDAYNSFSPNQFLNPMTGQFRQLDNSPWFIKKKPDGKVGYYLNMESKFQQMPDACFKATTEGSKILDVDTIKAEVKEFMEATDVKK
tara:strand:- start:360 stop:644 length:285 start_codon:yes stop_codon:yes gene_type:complete